MTLIHINVDYSESLDLFDNSMSLSLSEDNTSARSNLRFLIDPIQNQLDQLRHLWEDEGIYDTVANPELFDSWFDPYIANIYA